MRTFLIVAAAVVASFPACDVAMGADLAKPATPKQIAELPLPSMQGCYVEASAAGTFLRAGNRDAIGGIGGGCDAILSGILLGGGLRADFGDATAGSVFAKLGVMVNSSLALYGLAEWKVPDWKIKDAGQASIGAGLETRIQWVDGLSLFAEGTTSVSKSGPNTTTDDVQVRLGARRRF